MHTLAMRKLASAGDHIAFERPVMARWPRVLARKQAAPEPRTSSAQAEPPEAVQQLAIAPPEVPRQQPAKLAAAVQSPWGSGPLV